MFVCWSVKGGAGTTVVAAALALVLSRSRPMLLADLGGDSPAALGMPEPSGPGLVDWLASPLRRHGRAVAARACRRHSGACRLVPHGAPLVRGDAQACRTGTMADWAACSRSPTDTVVVDAGRRRLPHTALRGDGVQSLLVTRAVLPGAATCRDRLDAQPTGVVRGRRAGPLRSAPVDVANTLARSRRRARCPTTPRCPGKVDAGLLAVACCHAASPKRWQRVGAPGRMIDPVAEQSARAADSSDGCTTPRSTKSWSTPAARCGSARDGRVARVGHMRHGHAHGGHRAHAHPGRAASSTAPTRRSTPACPTAARLSAVIEPVAVDGPCLSRSGASRSATSRSSAFADARRGRTVALARRTAMQRGGQRRDLVGQDHAAQRAGHRDRARLSGRHAGGRRRTAAAPSARACGSRPVTPHRKGWARSSLAHLLRTALRMRPDRLVVGEVRGAEAVHLLQALNTGHDGSLCTVHANYGRRCRSTGWRRWCCRRSRALAAGSRAPSRRPRRRCGGPHRATQRAASTRVAEVVEVTSTGEHGVRTAALAAGDAVIAPPSRSRA